MNHMGMAYGGDGFRAQGFLGIQCMLHVGAHLQEAFWSPQVEHFGSVPKKRMQYGFVVCSWSTVVWVRPAYGYRSTT